MHIITLVVGITDDIISVDDVFDSEQRLLQFETDAESISLHEFDVIFSDFDSVQFGHRRHIPWT